jgi:tRNA modification GTPase
LPESGSTSERPASSSGPPVPTRVCRLTPAGEGGIGIVGLRGPLAAPILQRLFISPRGILPSSLAPGRLVYGRLVRAGEALDEVILERVDEDSFAVNCHGGVLALQRVLGALQAEGAQSVDPPGWLAEEARRGRRDPIRREVLERLPGAPTLRAVKALLDQYQGALLTSVRSIARAPEERAAQQVERLLATSRYGRALTEPLRLVIAGRPNAGKSALANALLRFDRMIVHAAPGTTRDTIEEVLSVRGVAFLLVDTAGLRETSHEVEREGVHRGREELRRADAAILVFDASMPLQQEDEHILAGPLPAAFVPVLNKCDLPAVLSPGLIRERTGREPAVVSALRGDGIDELEDRIVQAACPHIPSPGDAVVFTERQVVLLKDALAAARRGDRSALFASLHALSGAPDAPPTTA